MATRWRLPCLLALLLTVASPAGAEVVGSVKVAEGTAFVLRAGQLLPAQVGQRLEEGDGLRTGADGRLGVVLRDDSRLALGPDSELRLDQVVFAPAEGKLGLVVRLVRGVAAYLSGRIARLAPASVRFETPVAVVGIRGTRFAACVEP